MRITADTPLEVVEVAGGWHFRLAQDAPFLAVLGKRELLGFDYCYAWAEAVSRAAGKFGELPEGRRGTTELNPAFCANRRLAFAHGTLVYLHPAYEDADLGRTHVFTAADVVRVPELRGPQLYAVTCVEDPPSSGKYFLRHDYRYEITPATGCRYFVTTAPVPSIDNSPPDGVVGEDYSFRFDVSNVFDEFTVSVTGGSLPPGLEFDGDLVAIAGVPEAAGTYSFRLTFTTCYGTFQVPYGGPAPPPVSPPITITISPPPP